MRRLIRRKCRDEEGLFLAEGIRFVEEVLSSGWQVEFLVYSGKAAGGSRGGALLQAAAAAGIPAYEVDEKLLAELADTATPQGVLAAVRQKEHRLEEVINGRNNPLLLVVDGVQDPGNLGTIIRTADAAGAGGVLLLRGTVDLYNPKTLRSTMGSLFHVPVVRNLEAAEFLEAVARAGIRLYAGQPRATKNLFQADLREPCAFTLGSEGRGPRAEIAARAEGLQIPMPGRAESLNVAVAAAVMLYEALRQRGFAGPQ